MSIVDAATIVVAALAGLVIFWQGHLTRRHFRLSVKPYLFFDTLAFREEGESGLLLTNGGLGPAITSSFSLWVDGERVGGSEKEGGGWGEAKNRLRISFGYNAHWLRQDQIVKPGESFFIISLPVGGSRDQLEELDAAIRRLEINVTYKSMYGEKFTETWSVGQGMGLEVR